jgi:hypothetical protein
MKCNSMLLVATALALAGCNQNQTAQAPAPAPAPAEAAAPAPTAPAGGSDDRRQFMINVVAPATKPIWDLSYADKMSDADWETVKKATADLVAAMPQIAADPRGQDPKWKDSLMKVSASADAAAKAAAGKDQKALAMAGDDLVDECGACHMAFDPGAK